MRYAGVSSNAAESPIDGRIVNFVGFAISAQVDSNAIAICNYSYDYAAKMWKPTTWS